ncbi:MAG: hypothetical protein ABI852_01580 [Gemmatimonadaceae bacterium]
MAPTSGRPCRKVPIAKHREQVRSYRASRSKRNLFSVAPRKLIVVSPSGKLWPERFSDVDKLRSVGKLRRADVLCCAMIQPNKQPKSAF